MEMIKIKNPDQRIDYTMFLSIFDGIKIEIEKKSDDEYPYAISLTLVSNKENKGCNYIWSESPCFNKVTDQKDIIALADQLSDDLLEFDPREDDEFINTRSILESVIKHEKDAIHKMVLTQLNKLVVGCDFCLGNQMINDRDIEIYMENDKLHAQAYFENTFNIKFCPMCGRRLKNNIKSD